VATGSSTKQIEAKAKKEIPLHVDWLQTNRLSLNLKKTHIMLFGPNNKQNQPDIDITINDEKIYIAV
jgi:hypothetical protein